MCASNDPAGHASGAFVYPPSDPPNTATPSVSSPADYAELAAVLTYIRTSWGNRATPVTVADIARVRAKTKGRTKPFSEAELLALR